jgi:hypothetical protein
LRSAEAAAEHGGTGVFIIPRSPGQSIVIGDHLLVTILEVKDDEVRISVEEITGDAVVGDERAGADAKNQTSRPRPR